jgi:hypothetical protein
MTKALDDLGAQRAAQRKLQRQFDPLLIELCQLCRGWFPEARDADLRDELFEAWQSTTPIRRGGAS